MLKLDLTTIRGLEDLAKDELRALGIGEARTRPGGLWIETDLRGMYTICAWSRLVQHVLWTIEEFHVISAEALGTRLRLVPWEDLMRPEKTLSVRCTFVGEDQLADFRNSHYIALRVKDAICDRLREKVGSRPTIEIENPDIKIHLSARKSLMSLGFDAAGGSLHERGYRLAGGAAPMKETLASAMITFGGWDGKETLIDPMCGSGTIPLEAAQRAAHIPISATRKRYSLFHWPNFDQKLWDEVQTKFASEPVQKPIILGCDRDKKALEFAKKNAERALVGSSVRFASTPLDLLKPPTDQPGLIVINPPYGERLGEQRDLRGLYSEIGRILKSRFKGWRAVIISSDPILEGDLQMASEKSANVTNGPIRCKMGLYRIRA